MTDAFQDFWAVYPRKTAKVAAWRAFKKLNPSPELVEAMLLALERQIREHKWGPKNPFTPYPGTWLNQQRWTDEPPPSRISVPRVDWREECKAKHGGTCPNVTLHAARVEAGWLFQPARESA